tara:strand:- start:56 stop:391 length:336 start_codon:yes stop_codon:yes gene_type:complete
MAIIYTYPLKSTPALEDLILISDMSSKKLTKSATITSLKDTIDVVDSFNSLTGAVTITGGTNVTLTTSGNNIEINSPGINLAEHADNTAALAAGLVAGDFYRTVDFLKVVH